MITARITVLLTFSVVMIAAGQSGLTGLWEIRSVTVGNEEMTPVARWTRIHANGTLESGNGWMQHTRGTYSYDPVSREFMPDNPLGVQDEAGPFTVSFEDGKMIWRREEDGLRVVVVSEKVEELPMTPADLLNGLWDLAGVTVRGEDLNVMTDPDNQHYIYFGWDRIYRARNAEGKRITGYWHVNAHHPQLVLLPHQENGEPLTWTIEVGREVLRLTGVSESIQGEVRTYRRQDHWPEN